MTNRFLSPSQLRNLFPLSEEALSFIEKSRELSKEILSAKSPKKVLIVGPCSLHAHTSALKYAKRLSLLQKTVENKLFLIMRAFIEKPRTRKDWKGFLYDPYLDESESIEAGVLLSRKLLTEISALNVPIAMEFLDPLVAPYFNDLVTWGFIGARTSNSQPHRQFVSSLQIPVGIKNSLDGHVESTIHSIVAAQHSHSFLYPNDDGQIACVKSQGNPYAHLVLRGGRDAPNYDQESILSTKTLLIDSGLKPHLLIDCAHGNSGKSIEKQKEVFKESSQFMAYDPGIIGLMLESHILRGSQNSQSHRNSFNDSISITDPCLGWEETEHLILECYQLLSKGTSSYVGSSKSSSLLSTGSS